jgi:hypothetical protein
MSKKRSETSSGEKPPKIHDLKLINGIGPIVERRLNGVGIYTYAQLATLSPADVAAAVAGTGSLTSERIIKQDWIGQARKLASESVSSDTQEGVEAPIEHAHSATPSDEVPPAVAELELAAPAAEVTEPVPPPVVAITEPTGAPRLSQIETVLAGAYIPQNFFAHSQPFDVHLTLDLSDVRVPPGTQFSYRASIYSKSLEGRPRQAVGETSGSIASTHKVTVSVEGAALPKGTYRLKAMVILNWVTTEPTPQSSLVASKESDLLLIF